MTFSSRLRFLRAVLAVLSLSAPCAHAQTAPALGNGISLVGNAGYYAKDPTKWATQAGMNYYLGKGMKSFRQVFAWEWTQPTLNGPLDAPTMAGLDGVVSYLAGRGATVILDMHNFGRRDTNWGAGSPNNVVIGAVGSAVTAAHLADAWVKIAQRYATNPKVVLEIMNEPHDQDSTALVATYNQVIAAIRAAGVTNTIMIDGNDWTNAGRWTTGSDPNAVEMLLIDDPLNNVVFDVHQYFDAWSAGQAQTCNAGAGRSLTAVTAWARANKKRLYLGEFGGGKNAQCYAEIRKALDTIAAAPDVWTGWSWWGSYAGQKPYNTPDSFWYTIDPAGGDVQDFASAIEDPRMTVLRGYLP